jgi:hypothetical protein
VRSKKEIKEDNVTTRNLVRQKTKKEDQKIQELLDSEEIERKMIEDMEKEIESEF